MKMDMRGSVEGCGREGQQQASDAPSLIKRGLCGDKRRWKGRLENTGMIRAPEEPTQGPSLLYSGHFGFCLGNTKLSVFFETIRRSNGATGGVGRECISAPVLMDTQARP